jgi:hypothetical protein
METSPEKNLRNLYENLTFFDNYGSSIIFFVLITIFLLLSTAYFISMSQAKQLRGNWEANRCKPSVLPFAGFINKPDNMTADEFTKQNFDYCMQNELKGLAAEATTPLTYVTSSLVAMADQIMNAMNAIRAMMSNMRGNFSNISEEIYEKMINFIIPVQEILVAIQDSFAKLIGGLVAVFYSFVSTFYGIQSLFGVIAEALVKMLIALAAIVMLMWLTPATWSTAAAGTALFGIISVPLIILLAFLQDAFGIQVANGKLKAPSPHKLKCFDENTLFQMDNGEKKEIKYLKPGDVLVNKNAITSVIKVETHGSIMYNLHGTIVSNSHLVLSDKKFIRVSEHKEAKPLYLYGKPYIYCLNTEHKYFDLNGNTYSDWDELYGKKLKTIIQRCREKYGWTTLTENRNEVHEYLANAFHGDTLITLQDEQVMPIKDIKVGSVLKNGNKVYGIVKTDGKTCEQYEYIFNNNNGTRIIGTNNMALANKSNELTQTIYRHKINNKWKIEEDKKEEYLYNLLTNTETFEVNRIIEFCDYNVALDFFVRYS